MPNSANITQATFVVNSLSSASKAYSKDDKKDPDVTDLKGKDSVFLWVLMAESEALKKHNVVSDKEANEAYVKQVLQQWLDSSKDFKTLLQRIQDLQKNAGAFASNTQAWIEGLGNNMYQFIPSDALQKVIKDMADVASCSKGAFDFSEYEEAKAVLAKDEKALDTLQAKYEKVKAEYEKEKDPKKAAKLKIEMGNYQFEIKGYQEMILPKDQNLVAFAKSLPGKFKKEYLKVLSKYYDDKRVQPELEMFVKQVQAKIASDGTRAKGVTQQYAMNQKRFQSLLDRSSSLSKIIGKIIISMEEGAEGGR